MRSISSAAVDLSALPIPSAPSSGLGLVHHALQHGPEGEEELSDPDGPSPRSGTRARRDRSLGVSVGGREAGVTEVRGGAGRGLHAPEARHRPGLREVRADHEIRTDASVQCPGAPAVLASTMFDEGRLAVALTFEEVGAALGSGETWARKKCTAAAPPTVVDVLKLALVVGPSGAGTGLAYEMALRVARSLLGAVLAARARAVVPTHALPMIDLQIEEVELDMKKARRRLLRDRSPRVLREWLRARQSWERLDQSFEATIKGAA